MHSTTPKPDAKHFALVDLFPDTIDQWGIYHQAHPLPTYSKGLVALLGDSAHASQPFLSTGAGIGYEDAAICAELLHTVVTKQLKSTARQTAIKAALKIYSDVRMQRSQYMVRSSSKAGEMLMGRRPTFKESVEEYSWRNHEVWDFDIAENKAIALRRLEDEVCS